MTVLLAYNIQHGFLIAEPIDCGYTFRQAPGASAQYLDLLEFGRLRTFEEFLTNSRTATYNGWQVLEHEELHDVQDHAGAFLSRQNDPFKGWHHDDVDSLMVPLIRPWKTNQGTMMAYDALPEIDNHFLSLALEFMGDCRNEVGIHPSTELTSTNGADIVLVATAVTSFHMKHVRFGLLAMKHCKEISIPQSLTIWAPEAELAEGIADWSGLPLGRVQAAMKAITFRASEAQLRRRNLCRKFRF